MKAMKSWKWWPTAIPFQHKNVQRTSGGNVLGTFLWKVFLTFYDRLFGLFLHHHHEIFTEHLTQDYPSFALHPQFIQTILNFIYLRRTVKRGLFFEALLVKGVPFGDLGLGQPNSGHSCHTFIDAMIRGDSFHICLSLCDQQMSQLFGYLLNWTWYF